MRETQHCGRRTLDGGQRRPQLVAQIAKELRALPLHLFHEGYVLHCHNYGHDISIVLADRSGIDKSGDRPSVWQVYDDLVGKYILSSLRRPRRGKFIYWDFTPVRSLQAYRLQELVERTARCVQPADNSPRLIIG